MKIIIKGRRSLLFVILLSLGTVLFCYGSEIKAMVFMTYWNHLQKKDSLLSECGLSIYIPGGLSTLESDWFPFVMSFNADQMFSAYKNQPDLRLTVLYNFPAFSVKNHCSRLYDPESPYYNSFYGAYVVRAGNGSNAAAPYGFFMDSDGGCQPDTEAIAQIPCFDYQRLVLQDFGLKKEDFIFDWHIIEEKADIAYAGYDGWTLLKAKLTVSGAVHQAKKGVFSYIQYGIPAIYKAEDFSPASMKGQIYARYFPENDVSVFLYIVASDESVLEKCEKSILSKIRIK